ncbi:MAG: Anaphase-promoting complex subunit 1 [Chaenotheca gracillima]|nr:MAG: Anaphase-promoting complex subunit 1 [Chaenotheca gracillima]
MSVSGWTPINPPPKAVRKNLLQGRDLPKAVRAHSAHQDPVQIDRSNTKGLAKESSEGTSAPLHPEVTSSQVSIPDTGGPSLTSTAAPSTAVACEKPPVALENQPSRPRFELQSWSPPQGERLYTWDQIARMEIEARAALSLRVKVLMETNDIQLWPTLDQNGPGPRPSYEWYILTAADRMLKELDQRVRSSATRGHDPRKR